MEKSELTGAITPEPNDQPIFGCRDAIPKRLQVSFDIGIVIKLTPPFGSLREVVGCDGAATQVVSAAQYIVVTARLSDRHSQAATGGVARCDVEPSHGALLIPLIASKAYPPAP